MSANGHIQLTKACSGCSNYDSRPSGEKRKPGDVLQNHKVTHTNSSQAHTIQYLIDNTISYLTHSTDAHVKGICPASCPIQHLRGQFNSEASSFGLAPQCTGCWGVIRHWDPLIGDTLVLDVIVCWTLLSPEITWCCWAVLGGGIIRTSVEVGVLHHNNLFKFRLCTHVARYF